MDRLFAPWRMNWVTRDDDGGFEGCVFCELHEAGDDPGHRIVARSDRAYVVVNNSPYTPGHVLVVPYAHGGDVESLDTASFVDCFELLQTTVEAVKLGLEPDGFNVGMNVGKAGGASITDHLHVHLVPRWAGDTTFMPTTANTKILAEALDETYTRLRDAFVKLDAVEERSADGAVVVE